MTAHRWDRGVLRRLRGRDGDQGVALVVVLGTMLVLASLATVTLTYAVAGQKFARYDQDYAAAMNAAQSGVDDFISRLNRDETYGKKVDCNNLAWQGPMDASTNTCGWTPATATGWLPVDPGDTDPTHARFHYIVDATFRDSTGTVTLQVTGRVNGVNRTVETAVGKGGSTDYVYYTNYESADPSNVQAYDPNTTAGWSTAKQNACGLNGPDLALYWYEKDSSGNTRDYYNCTEITFIGADTLNGPVFTNDTIYATSNPSFLKGVETASPNCQKAGDTVNGGTPTGSLSWNAACLRSGSTANFNGVKPLYEPPLYLEDNSAAFATDPGCHYYGSTRVIFQANGTMRVWNKTTVNGGIAPVSIAPPGGTAPDCGDLVDLNTTQGQLLSVPDGMVIYADAAPGAKRQCYATELGGSGSDGALPLGTYSSTTPATPTGANQSYSYDSNMVEAPKMCQEGNLYAQGVLSGRVTIAAAQSVIVTGDLVLAGGLNGPDMLGLVATNSVEVFHPELVTVTSTKVNSGCNSNCAYKWGNPGQDTEVSGWPVRYKEPGASGFTPTKGIQIAGSIQTLQHSFLVQKYSEGDPLGTLLVNGSIAQQWRGIVGQGGGTPTSGYAKLYQYDTRLKYARPPYFPTWVNSEWSERYSGEITTPAGVTG
ncbi:MAG TPA: hypothetical protein VGC04_06240 [Cellulomonas sp.]